MASRIIGAMATCSDSFPQGQFDFVVLQQGPSSQSEGRAMLLNYGVRIKALCDTTKTRLAFFMVWPAFTNLHTFDGVIKKL
jgi:hypothetical protein